MEINDGEITNKVWIAKAFEQSHGTNEPNAFYFAMLAEKAKQCRALITRYQLINQQPLSIPLAPLPLSLWRERHEPLEGIEEYLTTLTDDNQLITITMSIAKEQAPAAINVLAQTVVPCPPLDSQFWVDMDEQKQVPEGMEVLLWPTVDSKCYALIDASCNNMITSMLEHSELVHACLYKGLSYESFSEQAPWLVELDRESDFVRRLFTLDPEHPDSPLNLWQYNAASFIVSKRSFNEVFQHCRKFIYLKNHRDKWIYFNFHRGEILATYLTNNAKRPNKIATFFAHPKPIIDAVVIIHAEQATSYTTVNLPPESKAIAIELDEHDMRPIIDQYNRENICPPIVESIKKDNPKIAAIYSDKELTDLLLQTIQELRQYGLVWSRSSHVVTLFKLYYGNDWLALDDTNQLEQILQSKQPEKDKISALIVRMQELDKIGKKPKDEESHD